MSKQSYQLLSSPSHIHTRIPFNAFVDVKRLVGWRTITPLGTSPKLDIRPTIAPSGARDYAAVLVEYTRPSLPTIRRAYPSSPPPTPAPKAAIVHSARGGHSVTRWCSVCLHDRTSDHESLLYKDCVHTLLALSLTLYTARIHASYFVSQ